MPADSRPLAGPPRLPPGVRDAAPGDRAALLDLWVLAWRAAMPAIDFEARRAWLDRHLDALAGAGARVLAADGPVGPVGFVTVDSARRHLDQLAVHPAHQGTGVADRLMAAAKALSPAGLRLDVNADNSRALRFYARHGFALASAGVNPRSGLPTRALLWCNDGGKSAGGRGH